MKPWAWAAVAGVALAGGGYALGRFSAPAKTTETVTVREDLQSKATIRQLTAELETAKKNTHSTIVTRWLKDGTSERHETVDTQTSSTRDARHDVVASTDTRTVKATTASKTTTLRPDWRLGVMAGGSLTAPALPLAGPLAVGVLVERRIIGPVSLGVWGLSSGQAGAAVTVEF